LSIHEYAHARVAKAQGDYTAEQMGRITLNPLYHIDPLGTIILPLMLLLFSGGRIGFGWAKPVPINPFNFRSPRQGLFLVSLAGPVSNITLALACGLALRVIGVAGVTGIALSLQVILVSVTIINLYLAFFNLIPIPPLDGSGVLSSVLPAEYARKYDRLGRYGTLLILGLLVIGGVGGTSIIHVLAGAPAQALFSLFAGQPYWAFVGQ
jgi:Zn-dependent protease